MEIVFKIPKTVTSKKPGLKKDEEIEVELPTKMSGTITYDQPGYNERGKIFNQIAYEIKEGVAHRRSNEEISDGMGAEMMKRVKSVDAVKDNGFKIDSLDLMGMDRMGSLILQQLSVQVFQGADLGE